MRALKITNSITRRDEKSMEKYLTEISRYDVLSPEEELTLFQKLRNGNDQALQKIVNHNLRFVVSVAKQYQNLGLSLGDLINEGNIGLIKAAERFDETKGFKFISYAVWWIRQSILQAVNEKSRKIRVPMNVTGTSSKVRALMIEILQKEEREASIEELVEKTGLTKEAIKKSMDSYRKCQSLDAPVREDSDMSLTNVLEDDQINSPDHSMAVKESIRIEVEEMLKTLPDRQATILSMYFGIGEKHPSTLDDIADHIGVSRERVRQIRDRGLRKLRLRARVG